MPDSTAPTNGIGATVKIPAGVDSFSFTRSNTSTTGGDGYFFGLSSVCGDTDGDGIQNHLDLDSDNDSCLDSLE